MDVGGDWDVAIVGGGPAGSVSALLLAQRGYRVVVLDRAHFPRSKPCGEYLSPGVYGALSRLGLKDCIPEDAVRLVPGMDIRSPGERTLRIQYAAGDRAGTARSVPRHVLDHHLLRESTRHGVVVAEGFVAREPVLGDDVLQGVRGTFEDRQMTVRARLTVVADGSRSIIARRLGLAQSPRWPVRLGLVAHFRGHAALDDGFGQMHVARHGYCGVNPLSHDCLNVAVVVPSHALKDSSRSATQFFDRWIAEHPELKRVLTGCERITSVHGLAPIGGRVRRAWAPGALLVGDAAGFFDPFTGEGIYRALRGAELVAEIADRSLRRGSVSGTVLAEYDAMRHEEFRRKHAVTALVQLFVQCPLLMEYALPRIGSRPKVATALSNVLGDLADARSFLAPAMLWSALRP